jgi:plasmid stability protein
VSQVLIRNIAEDLIETYKIKARLKGTSLEQYLRDLMIQNAPFTAEERIKFSEEMLARSGGPHTPLSKEEIREGLE